MQQQQNSSPHSAGYELAWSAGVTLAQEEPGLPQNIVVHKSFDWFSRASGSMLLSLDETVKAFSAGYEAFNDLGIV